MTFRSRWERRLGHAAESPIESMFLDKFCGLAQEYGYHVASRATRPHETIVVEPQRWVDRSRVDFGITFAFQGTEILIAVECDGHAFHERTKTQAKRDRSRDRQLQAAGYRVFRFTGSEIHSNPSGAAFEVLDAIMTFQTGVFVRAVETAQREAA